MNRRKSGNGQSDFDDWERKQREQQQYDLLLKQNHFDVWARQNRNEREKEELAEAYRRNEVDEKQANLERAFGESQEKQRKYEEEIRRQKKAQNQGILQKIVNFFRGPSNNEPHPGHENYINRPQIRRHHST